MKKADKIMAGAMTSVMLNCDRATFLISKNEVSKLSCIERVKLKMHLLSCKYCRRFAEQSKLITNQIKLINTESTQNIKHYLSPEQKIELQKCVNDHLDKKN